MSIAFIIFGWVFIVASAFWLTWFWRQRPQKNVPIDPVASICESCGGEADFVCEDDVPLCQTCFDELLKARGAESC